MCLHRPFIFVTDDVPYDRQSKTIHVVQCAMICAMLDSDSASIVTSKTPAQEPWALCIYTNKYQRSEVPAEGLYETAAAAWSWF